MAVEAQRLIAISLGKMASSRAQRGGARLHKSLLVASVLHSAQTVALLNDPQNPNVTLCSPPSNTNIPLESCSTSDFTMLGKEAIETDGGRETVSPLFDHRKYSELRVHDDDESDSEEETDLVTLSSCVSTTQTEGLAIFTSDLEELRSTSNTFNVLVNSNLSCGQFLDSHSRNPKRKRGESDEDDEPQAKQVRFVQQSSDYSSSCTMEPMQTDSSWQVANLVYSFSMGFSGLLRSCDGSEYCSLDSSEQDPSLHNMHSSTTSESIISCSTQIREALDTLTRPAIAMTV